MGFLRLPLVLFAAGLLLLTMSLMVARRNPSHAYWITAEGGNVGEYGLYRLRPDGKARRVADFGAITGHAWSPDGRSMVVAVENGPAESKLYRVQANGEIIGRVLVATQDLFHPAFSPDGRSLTFTTRGVTMGFQINQLNLSSGVVTRMIQSSGGAMMGAWSPDSTMLAYSAQRSDYGADIYLRQFGSAGENTGETENGRTLILTSANGADASPEFSPDGKWIAFMSDRTGSFHIYVMRTDGSAAHLIGGRIRDERWPVWTPDGEWVIFSSIQGDGTPTLYRMRPDGTNLQRLSHLPLAAAKCSPLIDRTWQPMGLVLLVFGVWGVEGRGVGMWRRWVRRWRGAPG